MSSEPKTQRFGEYDLVERIAVGGMAEVWKARVKGLAGFEKTLVVKKILDGLARDEEFVRLFIDEARIAVMLQHHNIVQVFDLGTADGSLYMAMEYVQGEDLSRIVKRLGDRPFPISLALFIVGEVLKALRFAHERRDEQGRALSLVHCDISPQNVLVSQAGEVKITDFGISRAAFQASSLHDTVRGKYAYMSPEQIENKALDHRSDLFSLGIVLWEVLTGKRLFKGRNKDETLGRVKRAEVPSPRLYRPDITEDVEGFVLRALARTPDQRFDDAAAMLDALGLLMVREGHRATNNELASFMQSLGPHGTDPDASGPPVQAKVRTLVVLAAEPRFEGPAPDGLDDMVSAWADDAARHGAQVWEKERGGLLAVWVAEEGELDTALGHAAEAVDTLRGRAKTSDASLVAGIAPGRARLFDDSNRPGRGWELEGPFYLARWLMNRSADAGSALISGAAARRLAALSASTKGSVSHDTERIGRLKVGGRHHVDVWTLSP